VDVARALALLGMMSVHILPQLDPDGRVSTAFVVASGRSSALFALLAGTGLALLTGGSTPRLKPYRDIAAGVLTRAVLLAGIGLSLGELMPPVIVILTNYGLLFVVALAVLALPAKALMALAGAWVVTTPLLSHVLRADLPAGQGEQPSLSGLLQPIDTLRALTLTGYYPILQWSAYLFVGIAVGRLTLGRVRTSAWLTATGLALAIASRFASDQLLLRGGLAELRAAGPTELVPQGSTTTPSASCRCSRCTACRRRPGGGRPSRRRTQSRPSAWPTPSARDSRCSGLPCSLCTRSSARGASLCCAGWSGCSPPPGR
jgi:uncharacterized membrane protein